MPPQANGVACYFGTAIAYPLVRVNKKSQLTEERLFNKMKYFISTFIFLTSAAFASDSTKTHWFDSAFYSQRLDTLDKECDCIINSMPNSGMEPCVVAPAGYIGRATKTKAFTALDLVDMGWSNLRIAEAERKASLLYCKEERKRLLAKIAESKK